MKTFRKELLLLICELENIGGFKKYKEEER